MKKSNLVLCKGKLISEGRAEFNNTLPEDYPVIDEQVDKKKLFEILNHIVLNYPPSESIKVLDNIKDLGFKMSKIVGYTMGIEELYCPKFEKFMSTLKDGPEYIQKNMKKINEYKEMNKFIENKQYNDFIKSGSRGNMDQLKQMILGRLYIADSNNKIRPDLIRSSLVKGLNEKEFFSSSYGCRKGLLDTALSTSGSGYITRQLIYSNIGTELSETVHDCGTTEYLNMKIEIKNEDGSIDDSLTEKLAKSLIWRYIKISSSDKPILITKSNYKSIIGKNIHLRSPIFCKSHGVCKTCYGNLWKLLHSDQIGVIATQAIGELAVQLTLRTFHLGGIANTKSTSETNDDIVSGMAVLNKLFHNPYKVLKTANPEEFVLKLFDIFKNYGNVNSIHYEVLISSTMWYKNHQWRLIKNRNNFPFTYESILQIPNKQSWLLGVAFSRLKSRLLDSLLDKRESTPSSIDNMFKY